MPLIATRGAASVQGFGEFAQTTAPVYIEDVFSTYLYTGNGSTQTITNNIDLSTKGGLVWIKDRTQTGPYNALFDTVRGATKQLVSNEAFAQFTSVNTLTAFLSSGFSIGSDSDVNINGNKLVSWTFREQPKFFDIVTYTGNGATNRAISHNLGSTPGCIMIKCTSSTASWSVWHQDIGTNQFLTLNTAAAAATDNTQFGGSPTSTTFTVAGGGAQIRTNQNGETYVAYLFAHNAGGFGLTGSDNVISCGSFTTNASGGVTQQTLGYEPQFAIFKQTTSTGDRWRLVDNMRGMFVGTPYTASPALYPNLSDAESSSEYFNVSATGFSMPDGTLSGSQTYIYIAIRRGPMKTPTSGTSVFSPNIATTNIQSGTQLPSAGFPVDLQIGDWRNGAYGAYATDRLRGGTYNYTFNTDAEGASVFAFDSMTNVRGTGNFESTSNPFVFWQFRRAPGFFDEVCYDGNSVSGRSVNHNLGVAPELIIVKSRNAATNWGVYCQPLGNTKRLILNLNVADNADSSYWNNTSPTSSVFYVGNSPNVNTTSQSYVAYLFATVAGVSKVGSYTGTGALQTVNCGFTGGARFVLIKRTDSTGDWWVYDSARGITSGNDPYLFLNSTAAEVTNTNYVDTTSVGFQVTAAAPAGLNANGGSYIFLAVA